LGIFVFGVAAFCLKVKPYASSSISSSGVIIYNYLGVVVYLLWQQSPLLNSYSLFLFYSSINSYNFTSFKSLPTAELI